MSMKYLRSLAALAVLVAPIPAFAAGTFFWTCDALTFGANDVSAGDTTPTANNSMAISATSPLVGGNSCLTGGTNASSYFIFDSASIAAIGEGAFAAWARWETLPSATAIGKPLGAYNSGGNDNAALTTDSTNHARLALRGSGSASTLSIASSAFSAATTYFIVSAYDIAGDRRFVSIYNSSCTLIETISDSSTDLASFGPTSLNQIRVGNSSSATGVLRVDNIVWASDYDDPVATTCPWTSYKPTYTTTPTLGTPTTTALPFSYKTDHSGVTYAAACTNGQTITTFANLKSGTCSGGAAVGTGSDANTQAVDDIVTITGLSAGQTYDVYIGQEDVLGWQSSISSQADKTTDAGGGGAPSFSVALALSSCDADSCVFSFTPSAAATIYWAAYAPGASAPADCPAIQAASGAVDHGGKAVTGADTIDVPFLMARESVYSCLTNGGGSSSKSNVLDQQRSAPSGWAIVCPSSVGGSSLPFSNAAAFSPDFAPNDCIQYQIASQETADCELTIGSNALPSIAPGSGDPADACDDRRTWPMHVEDRSSATGIFTDPVAGNWVTPKLLCNLNPVPELNDAPTGLIPYEKDQAIAAQDIKSLFTFAGSLTVTADTALPAGLTMTAGVITGTPTVQDLTGTTIEFTGTDSCGDSATVERTFFVIGSWTMVDLDGMTVSEAIDATVEAAPWRADNVGLSIGALVCDTATPSTVADQDPDAGASIEFDAEITVTLARACAAGKPKKLDLGLGLHL